MNQNNKKFDYYDEKLKIFLFLLLKKSISIYIQKEETLKNCYCCIQMMNIFIFLTDNNNKYFFLIELFYLFVFERCFFRKTNRIFKME